MPLGAIWTVYTVAHDMDLLRAFYEQALGLPLTFRDRDNWYQLRAGEVSFAPGSPSEAAEGARGCVVVFDAANVTAFVQRIECLGGRHLSSRQMGSHGVSRRLPTPENNLFQLHVRPSR